MPLPFMLSIPPLPQPLNMKGHSSVEGKAFRFKPRAQWPATARSEFGLDDLFFLHPVFVVRKLGRDSVEVVSVTSTRDAAVDPRNYLQIAAPIWMKKQTGPKLNLVNTPGYVTQLPKTSWLRLDKCREVPFEILQEWRRDDGVQFMLRKESTEKLYRFVRRAEAGWIDDRKEAGELTLPRTPPRTPSTFALYEGRRGRLFEEREGNCINIGPNFSAVVLLLTKAGSNICYKTIVSRIGARQRGSGVLFYTVS